MTEHNVLYVTPDGKFKDSASYSSRATFKHCKRLFRLTRIDGWRLRVEGVSTNFGNAVEGAFIHSTKNGGHGGVDAFTDLWNKEHKSKDFDKRMYRGNEDSFENLMRCGQEMLQIFELRFAMYPLEGAEFQVPLRKKIFPGTSYDRLTNLAYIDCVSKVDPHHPALTKVSSWSGSQKRKLIIDVKTSGALFPEKLIGLDPQLIEYAWQDGETFDVAFLNFVKESHGYKFNSRVTLLRDAGAYKAGGDVIVLDKPNPLEVWIGTQACADAYDKACTGADKKSLKGKALDAAAANFLSSSPAICVPQTAVSKQRVQFVSARIDPANVEEMGKVVGQTTVEMVVAHEQDFYPMESGLRYPAKKCMTCDMRYICSGDNEGRDRMLTKVGEEWLDSLVDEEAS